MNEFEVAGWIHSVQDELTTISRRLTGVKGYMPYEDSQATRLDLLKMSESLTQLALKMLMKEERESING